MTSRLLPPTFHLHLVLSATVASFISTFFLCAMCFSRCSASRDALLLAHLRLFADPISVSRLVHHEAWVLQSSHFPLPASFLSSRFVFTVRVHLVTPRLPQNRTNRPGSFASYLRWRSFFLFFFCFVQETPCLHWANTCTETQKHMSNMGISGDVSPLTSWPVLPVGSWILSACLSTVQSALSMPTKKRNRSVLLVCPFALSPTGLDHPNAKYPCSSILP